MANIEPYQYQKRTNIEEHNDLVSKINEIVDVINQTNIETIVPRISKLETDVSAINDTDNVQNTDIANLKDKDAQIDNRLANNESNISNIAKSLVSDVVLMNGTTTGNMKARIGREDAPSIDSNDYNIQKPVSVELVQGSASAMVKAKITLSDGTILISDDFMFTTEAIGTDVYISSFTFKNGNVAGTISADIGLSNGSNLEANNFVVPTDPNVISTISDIQNRLAMVESGTIEGLDVLKATVDGHTRSINELNATVDGHTRSINELNATVDGHTTSINELNTDVASLKTDKADVNNGNQTFTAGTINANNINKGGVAVATVNDIPDISGKVNIAQGTENAGKVLGIDSDGNVSPIKVSGEKKVYTGPLSDLLSFDTNNNTVTVLKDFDIEYIHGFTNGVAISTASIKKQIITNYTSNNRFLLGDTVLGGSSKAFIYLLRDKIYNITIDDNTNPTQIKSESMVYNSSGSFDGYRLWV